MNASINQKVMDKFYDVLNEANEQGLVRFIFQVDDHYYISIWTCSPGKWSDPV